MKTSAAGRALIESREGRRLLAYHDSQGILTIGVGHTGRMAPPRVIAGMTITGTQCDTMLAADLAPVEAVLNTAVKVPMSQNEFDAMASLGFNIGTGALRDSTVLRRLNLGDVAGAAAAFMMWDRPAVLLSRRRSEAAQFLAPDPGEASTVNAARAATLATLADTAKAKARAAQSGAATLVVASATTVATTHVHHPALALAIGALVMGLGGAAALVAAFNHSTSRTLAANGVRQAVVASAGTASNPLKQ